MEGGFNYFWNIREGFLEENTSKLETANEQMLAR